MAQKVSIILRSSVEGMTCNRVTLLRFMYVARVSCILMHFVCAFCMMILQYTNNFCPNKCSHCIKVLLQYLHQSAFTVPAFDHASSCVPYHLQLEQRREHCSSKPCAQVGKDQTHDALAVEALVAWVWGIGYPSQNLQLAADAVLSLLQSAESVKCDACCMFPCISKTTGGMV